MQVEGGTEDMSQVTETDRPGVIGGRRGHAADLVAGCGDAVDNPPATRGSSGPREHPAKAKQAPMVPSAGPHCRQPTRGGRLAHGQGTWPWPRSPVRPRRRERVGDLHVYWWGPSDS